MQYQFHVDHVLAVPASDFNLDLINYNMFATDYAIIGTHVRVL